MSARRVAAAASVLALAAGACSRGDDRGRGPSAHVVRLARAGDRTTYKAAYRFVIVGRLEESVQTTLSVVQRPPDSVRLLRTTSKAVKGKPVTSTQWTVRLDGKTYACHDAGETSCIQSEGPPGAFGYGRVDGWFEMARSARSAFASVEAAGERTLAGQKARCFGARGRASGRRPVQSPALLYDPTRFAYELCYTSDGIPVSMRETALGSVPSGHTRAEYVLEATELSRTVGADDLELPGPLRTPPPPRVRTPAP